MEAWRLARRWTPEDGLLCVAGSVFIVAELRALATADATAATVPT
jgi:hypothetical protein